MPRAVVGPNTWARVEGSAAKVTINTAAIYSAVEVIAAKVVRRAGQIAVGSARERAPVRKVFKGGRRTQARFYSLAEAKMELPAFLRSTGRSVSGRARRGQITNAEALAQLRSTPITTGRNRANSWQATKENRQVGENDKGYYLLNRYSERFLTTRGKYELKTGRALSVGEQQRSPLTKGTRQFGQFERFAESGLVGHLGGSLRRSIHTEDRSEGSVIKVSIVAGGDDAPYARFVEFGTRHAAAQPYLRPALKHVEGPFKQMMRSAFRGAK